MNGKSDKRTSVVLTAQDEKLVARIQQRLEKDGGKISITAVFRRAIRALAERLSLPI
jgi:hypothetical protein